MARLGFVNGADGEDLLIFFKGRYPAPVPLLMPETETFTGSFKCDYVVEIAINPFVPDCQFRNVGIGYREKVVATGAI